MDKQEFVRYLHLYPAQESAREKESLNVMFAVKNRAPEPLDAELRLWLCPADGAQGWRLAASERRTLAPQTVSHIYMQLPAGTFSPENWPGEPEEFLLACADDPNAAAPGRHCTALLFIRP